MILTNRARRAFSSGRMTWLFTYNIPLSNDNRPEKKDSYWAKRWRDDPVDIWREFQVENIIADEVSVMARIMAIAYPDRVCERLENLLIGPCSSKILHHGMNKHQFSKILILGG